MQANAYDLAQNSNYCYETVRLMTKNQLLLARTLLLKNNEAFFLEQLTKP